MNFRISKVSIQKNPFIGLFFRTNNEHTLVPNATNPKLKELIEETMNTSTTELLINESGLLGLFSIMNSKGIVVPSFAEDKEISILKKLGLNVLKLERSYSPGNTLLLNDKFALANLEIPARECKKISDELGVEVFQHPLAGISTIGSHNVATNKGILAHPDMSEVDLKYIQKIFNIPVVIGSTNLGAGGNALGLVANDKGAIVGEITSGFETQRIYEALSD